MCKIIKCDTVVQSFSPVWLSVIPWTVTCHISLSFTISWSLLKCMSIESVMPTISSSFNPFSSCPQSFPKSWSFPVSWLFASGGQSIGASASASVLPMNTQGLFPLGLTGLISLLSKVLSRVFSKSKCLWGTCWSILHKLCPLQHMFGATNTTVEH